MISDRLLLLLTSLAFGSSLLAAHEEPPKTVKERMEQERHRKRVAAARIRTETVWKLVGESGKVKQLVTRYDRSGNAVEQFAFASDTIPSVRVLSHYTPEHVVYEQIVMAGSDTEKTAFTYLAPRIVAAATEFTPAGFVRGRLTYSYTDTLITASKTDSLDMPVYTIYYRYPEGTDAGEMAEARQVDASGALTTRIHNVYRGSVRMEKQVFNSRDSLDFTFLYTYTPDGEFNTLTKQMPDRSVAYERRYSYGPDGILESITEHDATGTLRLTLMYEYERYGNE
jgi:hypothetical protein